MTYIISKITYIYNPHINGLDYILVRSPILMLISSMHLRYANVNPLKIQKDCRWLLFVRTISGGIAIPLVFLGLKYLPSSKATLIINVHPLLVAIVAFFLLKEKLTKIDIFALMGSFVGILLFASHNNKSSIESSTKEEYLFGILMITFATLGMVVIAICLRIINQHIHATISPFYVSISNSMGMFILLAFSTKFFNIEHYTTFDV
jgi:drug/metabolite transporter (DMT)-like permease